MPAESRQPGTAAFKAAVARFYEDEFAQAEGTVEVRVAGSEIRVQWISKEGADPLKYAVRLLSAGDYGAGVPDAVRFCLEALDEFGRLPSNEVLAVVAEIAALGQGGLDVNDSAREYTLKSLPGRGFSGLQLVAMMYVGMKGVDPSADVGFDLSKEYEAACAVYQAKGE